MSWNGTADDRTHGPAGEPGGAPGTGSAPGPGGAPGGAGPALGQPTLSLPKAGGALRGMGEKFATNPATGTAGLTVPLAVTPARGAEPRLALGYDSGEGNSLFGLGWSLDLPSVSRATDKGLPRYLDDDVFQLTGAEDLVPAEVPAPRTDGAYDVTAYRPRTEGAFARIERWRHRATGDTHWRVTSRSNVTSLFGRDPEARIADPADPARRVYRWLLQQTADDRGNITVYEYKSEDRAGVDTTAPEERNRTHVTGRHPKRIRYGNAVPGSAADFRFEVVFDYGEHDTEAPTPDEARPWPVRGDPFSTRRPGFELRTQRLCRRVLMFHRIPELGPRPQLVHALLLGHAEDPAATKLESLTHRGCLPAGPGLQHADLPALTLGYTRRTVSAATGTLTSEEGTVRLDGRHQWTDLDGEGAAGILAEQGGAWYYRRNLGGGRFAPPRPVDPLPGGAAGRALLDLDGDGRPAVADLGGTHPGYHERTADGRWADFTPFRRLPALDWQDPNLRFADLTGDGLPDVLVTADDGLTWYPSEGSEGFGDSETAAAPRTEEHGPRLLFTDSGHSVHLADMTGDGLTDLVRIGNGETAYWPNLGHGRFGPKVTMSGAPVLDHPDRFDPRRVRLADIDGSAPADLLYLGPDGVRLWFNQAGNSFGPPERLDGPPHPGTLATASVADVLGRGTACLVVAEPRPDGEPQTRYVDLMAGGKPHLLNRVDNGTGLVTTIRYASATDHRLADEAAGRPWLTRLPFPVQVVAATVTHDSVADTTLSAAYRYRHGYFDGTEREFRGFGYVEQRDILTGATGEPHQPPAVVRRWQHTGWYPDRNRLATPYADEYGGPLLPAAPPPAGLTPAEEREAARALRGQPLREETYAEDGTPAERRPYLVRESSPRVRLLQPRGTAAHAVVLVLPGETLTVHSERQADDPRTVHEFALETDAWGNTLRSARIAYPRKSPADPEQERPRLTVTERTVTNDTDSPSRWRIGVPVAARQYEIGGRTPSAPGELLTADRLTAHLTEAARHEIPYHQDLSGPDPQRRLIAHTFTTYTRDDLGAELPLREIGARALPWRTYRLALAPGQAAHLYGDRVTDAGLREAGYVERTEGPGWWAPSARQEADPDAFCLPVRTIDPFGAVWHTEYDPHRLLPVRVRDPLANTAEARPHYRVLQPWLLTDPNGNRSAVRFDVLGTVVATAVLGKEGGTDGDVLDTDTAEAAPGDDPTSTVAYDLGRLPVLIHTSARERHREPDSPRQDTWTYLDGTGRVVLTKGRAEPEEGQGTQRWVGTGRTVYDDKGNPIRRYEPYFAPGSDFDTEDELVRRGVTPVLRYDPLGRLVRTDFPDGTWSGVVFTAWTRQDHDRNDTVRDSRWYAERAGLPDTDPQGRAARQTLEHAGTHTETRFDTLGNPHLTVQDNGAGGKLATEVLRDVQGLERTVLDARSIPVLTQEFDMLGRAAHSAAADTGERWALADVLDRPVRAWDGQGTELRWTYDELRRPRYSTARAPGEPAERLRVRYYYGEALADGRDRNLLTRPCLVLDGAGALRTTAVDFKGNVLTTERRLPADPAGEPDWSPLAAVDDPETALVLAAPLLETTAHTAATRYDALDRPILATGPDGSRTRFAYNVAGLPERVEVAARDTGTWTPVVRGVRHDERGRRTLIEYGCRARTAYGYERETFRLATADTTAADGTAWQRLAYAYDPMGNVVVADDPAQDTVFFRNTAVGARRTYTYDPVYRLVAATGREHIGQTTQPGPADAPFAPLPHAHDGSALRPYTETYAYDDSGNLLSATHTATGGGWTRRHLTAPDGNRLLATSLPGDPDGTYTARHTHDPNGNITAMPHLPALGWDAENRLARLDLGGGGETYYQYDVHGRRVRATTRRGGTTETRTWLGPSERYRRTVAGRTTEEYETLHVTDGGGRVALVETATVRDGRTVADPRPVVRYQLTDHLGSTALEVDQDGLVLSYEEYHPYGTTSLHAETGTVSRKRYRFTGKERDAESGFTYHGARYYAPWLGRWVSPDPAGPAGGTNRYAYVRDRPSVLGDADGRVDDEARAILKYVQKWVDDIPQKEFAAMSRSGRGSNAHLTLESALTLGWDAEGVDVQRVASEVLIDDQGVIRGVGVAPGSSGSKAANWRSVDVAVLKQDVVHAHGPVGSSTLIGEKAKDVIEIGLDYKTGAADMKGVAEMENLTGAPYVKVTQGGDVEANLAARTARRAAAARRGASAPAAQQAPAQPASPPPQAAAAEAVEGAKAGTATEAAVGAEAGTVARTEAAAARAGEAAAATGARSASRGFVALGTLAKIGGLALAAGVVGYDLYRRDYKAAAWDTAAAVFTPLALAQLAWEGNKAVQEIKKEEQRLGVSPEITNNMWRWKAMP
ncbi:SpvB/TcaC N-terminal domain-containing protein [Streptomyces naphthomycinicus]|uniref:SpvB/TcaC N-terminal domain-containing protein n=1 Tax=Streptomyces naphthomycinicus TaxID=2872625 RepID=UPI0021F2186C|nr:SpvB/TcaC N-terminal domain-containing protein [Streptomyces sp. TML10]